MPDSKDYLSRKTASAYQVEDPSEVVITDTGRQTAYKGDYVVTESARGFSYTYILSPDMMHEEWVDKSNSDTSVDDAKRNDEFASDPEETDSDNAAPVVTQAAPTDPAISADTQANPASAQNAGAVEGATPLDSPAPASMGSAGSEITGTDPVNDQPQEIVTAAAPNENVTSSSDETQPATTVDPAPSVSEQSAADQVNPDSPSSANVADVMPNVGDNMETAGPTDVNSDATTATPDENATAAETPSDESTARPNGKKRTLIPNEEGDTTNGNG